MLYKEKIKDNHILKNISWDIKKIKEADIKFIDGDRGKNYPSGNEIKSTGHCVFLDAKNITKFGFNIDKLNFIDLEKDSILKKGKLELNDIIITTRGTLNNIAWYSNEIKRKIPCARINSGMVIVRLGEKNDPNFINFFFKSKLWKEQCNNSGGVIPQLTIAKMNENYIIDVKIKEQKRIADVLSKQESIINKTKALIEQLDKRNTFMLDELLSGRLRIKEENGKMEFYKNPDDNWQTVMMNDENINLPKEWSTINLGDRGISFIKTGIEKFDGNKQYYATGSITKFKMDKEPTEIVSYDNRTSRANLDIKDNSIYFARMKDTLKVLRFKTKDNKILSTGFLGLQVDINKFNLDFIFFNIISNYFQKNKDKNCNGATQKSLSDASAKKIKIIFPKLDEQYKISIIMNNLYNEKEKYEELLIEEQKKFDFLLEELMSGRLRIEE